MASELDDQGRLYLPQSIRDRYGERFRIVELYDGVKLVPVTEDPVDGLTEALEGIRDVPISELEEQAEQAAREEARR